MGSMLHGTRPDSWIRGLVRLSSESVSLRGSSADVEPGAGQDSLRQPAVGYWVSGGRSAARCVVIPAVARVLAERGITDPGFRSRPLPAELVGSADLILTAERAHRTAVVQLDNRALQQPVLDDDDAADMVGGPQRGFQRCIDEIAGALSAFGVAASTAPGPSRRWRRSR